METLLLSHGFVDELIPVAVPWLRHVSPWKKYNPFSLSWPKFALELRQLRAHKFDLAFPGGRSDLRYNLVLWLAGARRRVGYEYAGGGCSFLTDIVVPDLERPHQTELSLRLLEHLGIEAIRDGQMLSLSPDDERFSARFTGGSWDKRRRAHRRNPCSSRVPTRQWGAAKFKVVSADGYARSLAEK